MISLNYIINHFASRIPFLTWFLTFSCRIQSFLERPLWATRLIQPISLQSNFMCSFEHELLQVRPRTWYLNCSYLRPSRLGSHIEVGIAENNVKNITKCKIEMLLCMDQMLLLFLISFLRVPERKLCWDKHQKSHYKIKCAISQCIGRVCFRPLCVTITD